MKKLWIGVIVVAVVVIVAAIMYRPVSNTRDQTINPQTGSGSGSSTEMLNNSGTSAGSETTNPAAGGGSSPSVQNITGGSEGITLSELATHSKKSDCWVAYDGEVYDITKWLPVHPGGSRTIEPYCGTSSEFAQAFTGQHGKSQVARLKNQEFKGNLV